jgi:hypothetical protein
MNKKSNKAAITQRVDDVTILLVAGAEFANLRQFSAAHGWGVTDRQIRRYMKVAYRQMEKATCRNRRQLLGLHLTKRRVLYAKCIKANDHKTALLILGDEAALLGLYPPTKIAPTSPDGNYPYSVQDASAVSQRERVGRYLKAQFGNDKAEVRFVEQISPQLVYHLSDTDFPILLLNMLAMRHVIQQLETVVLFHQVWAGLDEADDDAEVERLWRLMTIAAHKVRVGAEAWARFTAEIGVDGQALIESNHPAGLLLAQSEFICRFAPAAEELPELAAQMKLSPDDLPTVESSRKSWSKLYVKALDE